ncbi:hypothetical protein CTI12_AA261990 [Artemisia annua]|uniref:Uncharacterized protein n=1 Tax=Artemisia annua TaxID=35608 RepID=A0A2U1NIH7_ARTAN|nr:hypothetical protein CTI12_AA261990 [Artemisia annua]
MACIFTYDLSHYVLCPGTLRARAHLNSAEYAYTLQVDEKSDIYSYGVLLMELISGKRSVDSEFREGNSIVDWVRSKNKVQKMY